jgi:hypothetical protein
MKSIVIILILLFCVFTVRPNSLTIVGKVIDENTGLPVSSVSVFLSNTTIGDITGKNGLFVLTSHQKGSYVLVASHLSYATYSMEMPMDKDSVNVLIKLKLKVYQLETVNVSAFDRYREFYLNEFKFCLIGSSKNAEYCKIINTSAVKIKYLDDPRWNASRQFMAYSDSALIIENMAMGYKINYNLEYFTANYCQTVFYGFPMYVDMLDKTIFKKKKIKTRKLTYEGSKMHFFRSLYTNCLETEGFETYKINMLPKSKEDTIDYMLLEDSVFIGKSKTRISQTQDKFNLYDSVITNPNTGQTILNITVPFEVRYIKRGEELQYINYPVYFDGLKRTPGAQATIVKLINGSILFYPDGSYVKPSSLVTIGYWSSKKMADYLPYNYLPIDNQDSLK